MWRNRLCSSKRLRRRRQMLQSPTLVIALRLPTSPTSSSPIRCKPHLIKFIKFSSQETLTYLLNIRQQQQMRLPHLSRLPPRRRPHTICSICRTNILRTTCSRRSTSSSLQKLLQPTMALVSLQSSPNILNISSSSSLSTRRCPRNQFTTSQPPSRHHHLSLHLTCSMLRFPPELIPKVVCLLAYSNKRCSIKQLG